MVIELNMNRATRHVLAKVSRLCRAVTVEVAELIYRSALFASRPELVFVLVHHPYEVISAQ